MDPDERAVPAAACTPRGRGIDRHRPGYTSTRCWCLHRRHARGKGLTLLFRVPVNGRLCVWDRFTVHLRLNGRWHALADDHVTVTWEYPWVWVRAVWVVRRTLGR